MDGGQLGAGLLLPSAMLLQSSPQLSPLQQGMEAAPTSAALHPPLGIHTKRGELSLSYTAFSVCSYCGPTLKMQHLTPSLSVSTGS